MRKFITSPFREEVDLDDPETYKHLPGDVKALDNLMFTEIGKAFVYMDYFPSRKGLYPKRKRKGKFVPLTDWQPDADPEAMVEINNSAYNQRKRIEKLVLNFATYRKDNYHNVAWYQEQIFMFQDEAENMC